MEEENRKLGELTLEEFAAIFETSAKDQKSKSGIRRNQLKSSIKTDGNKGKIIAIIQPLLEIYDALSDTKPKQGTLERIKAVWPDIREKTTCSSGADSYFGEMIVKDDSKYMRKIKEELENVKESTVKEISNILINCSEENGERHLMFCLETDKRGKGNAVQTQYQNLPTYDVKEKKYYGENEDIFANGFYIPENVIIIGTMNDIDRSVESMDFALRRRFIWKEVEVTRDLLKNSLKGILGEYKEKYKCNFECNKVAEVIADSIMNLNNEKLKDNPNFGKHYFISQGQFANLPGNIINQAIDAGEKAEDKTEAIAKSLISSVWDLRLESLLYEYIRGEGDEQDFVEECKKALESREEKESTQA